MGIAFQIEKKSTIRIVGALSYLRPTIRIRPVNGCVHVLIESYKPRFELPAANVQPNHFRYLFAVNALDR
jgi:hypothetical protein